MNSEDAYLKVTCSRVRADSKQY